MLFKKFLQIKAIQMLSSKFIALFFDFYIIENDGIIFLEY
jgi:hypothetical protein